MQNQTMNSGETSESLKSRHMYVYEHGFVHPCRSSYMLHGAEDQSILARTEGLHPRLRNASDKGNAAAGDDDDAHEMIMVLVMMLMMVVMMAIFRVWLRSGAFTDVWIKVSFGFGGCLLRACRVLSFGCLGDHVSTSNCEPTRVPALGDVYIYGTTGFNRAGGHLGASRHVRVRGSTAFWFEAKDAPNHPEEVSRRLRLEDVAHRGRVANESQHFN